MTVVAPTDLFYSSRLTLVHAQQHIQNFNVLVDDFVNGKPWSHAVDEHPQSGQHIHKIKFTRQLPQMLPCALFDIANNLRAALDQAGYAAAVAWRRKSDPKRTNFPFGDDPAGLKNNVEGRKVCEDCPPEIIALFRSFNPYKGGNDPLWALNKLCNTKKHCALVPLNINQASAFYTSDIIGAGWSMQTVSPNSTGLGWDPTKNEITLAITPPGVQPRITVDVAFSVAIGGIDTIGGTPARTVLANMSRIVETILLATEAECRRLAFKLD
jgi:hypothetical protein